MQAVIAPADGARLWPLKWSASFRKIDRFIFSALCVSSWPVVACHRRQHRVDFCRSRPAEIGLERTLVIR